MTEDVVTTAAWELQRTLRQRLAESLDTRAQVYDDVPRDARKPYVAIGEIRTDDWSTSSTRGFEHFVTLYVRSGEGGRRRMERIIADIEKTADAMHDNPPDLIGYRLAGTRVLFRDVRRDEETRRISRNRETTSPHSRGGTHKYKRRRIMIPQLGKDMLLKLDDGKGNFRVVAGLRTAEVSLKERAVDATHAESPKGWRQLLERAGEKSLALAGSGLFTGRRRRRRRPKNLLRRNSR